MERPRLAAGAHFYGILYFYAASTVPSAVRPALDTVMSVVEYMAGEF